MTYKEILAGVLDSYCYYNDSFKYRFDEVENEMRGVSISCKIGETWKIMIMQTAPCDTAYEKLWERLFFTVILEGIVYVYTSLKKQYENISKKD